VRCSIVRIAVDVAVVALVVASVVGTYEGVAGVAVVAKVALYSCSI